MPRRTYSEDKILAVLTEARDGATIVETCRKYGITEPTFYRWREKYAGLEKSDLARLKALESENERLTRMLADTMLESQRQKEALAKLGKR